MRIRQLINCISLAAGLFVSLMALQPVAAEAQTVIHRQAGSAGTAIVGSERSCFNMSFGTMVNTCTGTRGWEMPLHVESPSSNNVWAAMVTTGGGSMQCRAYAATANGTFTNGPAAITGTGSQVFTGITVGVFDTLNLWCLVPQNGHVDSAIWFIPS